MLACAKAYDSVPAMSTDGTKQVESKAVRKNFFESLQIMGILKAIKGKIQIFYVLFQYVILYMKSSDVA